MKVLLIEDNKTIANNMKKYLELSDFEVSICENGLF
jgi:DNA-binding response OmpR family regulator